MFVAAALSIALYSFRASLVRASSSVAASTALLITFALAGVAIDIVDDGDGDGVAPSDISMLMTDELPGVAPGVVPGVAPGVGVTPGVRTPTAPSDFSPAVALRGSPLSPLVPSLPLPPASNGSNR